MLRYAVMICGLVTAISVVALTAGAETIIVVDKGPFASIEAAAESEKNVNWNDADKADDTACTECFAAVELQHYLRKITGRATDFAFADTRHDKVAVIAVGQAAAKFPAEELADLGPDGYRIRTAVNFGSDFCNCAIAGASRLGTLYGVYDFLHRLGCRWYAPGEIHEVIPRLELDALPAMDVTETPDFAIRGFYAWEKRGTPDFIAWMARNRLNFWCVEEGDHPRLRQLGIKMGWGGHEVCTDYIKPDDPYPYKHAKFDTGANLPADPYPIGDEYLGDEDGNGVLSYWEAHPEWYAMSPEGKRLKELGEASYNFCTSNPHAMTESMQKAVRELIDGEARDAEIVNCWTVDGGKWCHCDACKKQGKPSDRNLRCVYAFDREVKKAQQQGLINRDITVLFLVYADVLEPPIHPLPDDFDYDTCIANFFPISRSYNNNFDAPRDPRNAKFLEKLNEWAVAPERYYQGQICIGEYYNVSRFRCLPICFMHTMANDIPYYYRHANARYFHYMHVTAGNWGNKALTNYQMARQIWDVETDCEPLWQDYFAGRYGPSANAMRAFYESLETMLCNCRDLKYTLAPCLDNGLRPIFSGDYLKLEPAEDQIAPSWREILDAKAKCRAILEEVKASNLPENIAVRVAEDDAMFTYGEHTLEYYDTLIRAYDAIDGERMDEAKLIYIEANRIGALLEADTVSTMDFVSPINSAPNALHASGAPGGLVGLYDLMGPISPEEYAKLDLDQQPCILDGTVFRGGATPYFGRGNDGAVVYGRDAGFTQSITAWFTLDETPSGIVTLTLSGIAQPVRDGGPVAGVIAVNGQTIYEGGIPYDAKNRFALEVAVHPGILRKGPNKIRVANTLDGRLRRPPWFGLQQIAFHRE